jgi:hypothetical protein
MVYSADAKNFSHGRQVMAIRSQAMQPNHMGANSLIGLKFDCVRQESRAF